MIIEEMTMEEFERERTRCRTVIIPFGSVEEHGRHLPLATDTMQAVEVAKKAAHRIPALVAPAVPYGNCRSTSCHPGTISISTSTLKALAKDIVISGRSQGLRNFLLISGHAGGAHGMALKDAGEELISQFPDITIAVIIEYHLARKAGSGVIETAGDSHAGEIETSRIMYTHPHLVKGAGKAEFPSFPQGILVRDKKRYWPDGVWGDPTKASADKGRVIEELVVDEIVRLVKEMESMED